MKISISKFRSRVSNAWLKNQKFPLELTVGAGNAKHVGYILTRAPLDPPLNVKEQVKLKLDEKPKNSPRPLDFPPMSRY